MEFVNVDILIICQVIFTQNKFCEPIKGWKNFK